MAEESDLPPQGLVIYPEQSVDCPTILLAVVQADRWYRLGKAYNQVGDLVHVATPRTKCEQWLEEGSRDRHALVLKTPADHLANCPSKVSLVGQQCN